MCALLTGALVFYGESRPVIVGSSASYERFARQFKYIDSFHKPAPLKSLEIYDLNGQRRDIAESDGSKLRIINFWASWCAPCIKELPTLLDLENSSLGQAVEVIYVSLDYPQSPQELREKMKKLDVAQVNTYYVRDDQVWEVYNLEALPTSLIVSKEGNILYRLMGEANWSLPQVTDFIGELL
jgi:thiol-disulfide isomerase/thioredoxin